MADSVSGTNSRRNRKRKADEAEIATDPQDAVKRLKIVSSGKSAKPHSIIPNENTDASNGSAGGPSAFQKLLDASDTDIEEVTPSDDKMLDKQPECTPDETPNVRLVDSERSPLQKSEIPEIAKTVETSPTTETAENSVGFQWGDDSNANTGFGSFASDGVGFGSFGSVDAADEGSAENGRPGGWGTPREFVFGADSSNFSFAELDQKSGSAKKKKQKNGKKEAFGFPTATDGDKPVAELKGEVDRGDRGDKTILALNGQVYSLDTAQNQYKERGVGEVKLNTYSAGKGGEVKARLLCRRSVTLKTIMNAIITKETKFAKATAKSVRFTAFEQRAVDGANDEGKDLELVPKSYLLVLKEADHSKLDTLIEEVERIQKKM